MNFKMFFKAIFLLLLSQNAFSQSFTISPNKRYLLKDNKPFFWLGDTAWELFHRLDREEAEYYLKKRLSQGFTVIQCVALAEMDGLNTPNAYGHKPLINNDPTKPNEDYFKHVDFVIDKAAELGLTIGLLPTWGDKLDKSSWGKGPNIFDVNNAKIYGNWIGTRYKNMKNIIWILGGDRNPREVSKDVEVWRAMANGIEAGVGGSEKAMMTFHPQPNDKGASEWFHEDKWLDFNMFQTGHCRDSPIYDKISLSYNQATIKPVIDGEPIYEDHPVCFSPAELGTSNAMDVRKAAYFDLFSGAFGHTYGCHDIWQMHSPKFEAINGPHLFWQQALDLTAAKQMIFLRRLIESRPMLDRVPDQSLIAESNLSANERIQATRGIDYAFVYTTIGKSFIVNMNKISGKTINAMWFNPRTGSIEEIGKFENKGTQLFTPKYTGYGHDMVLILDDASKNYLKP